MQESKINLDFVHDMSTMPSDRLPNMANREYKNLRGFYVSYNCCKQTNDNVISQLKAKFGDGNVTEVCQDNDQSRSS